MRDTASGDMDLPALADAAARTAAAYQQLAPLVEVVGDFAIDLANRVSRARFNYPGRVADTEPFPLLAGDVE